MKKLKLEEAITILQDMKVDIPVPKAAVMQTKRNVALDMAIEALKCSEIPNSSQCISRQAAIDEITEYGSGNTIYMSVAELKRLIEHLQSAQPEQRWIPWSSGKFPEESGTYTVTAYDGATKRVTYAKYQKRLKRWELTGARAYWRVLAWMPLPEPYAERREDG